jgi:hypothetical protein
MPGPHLFPDRSTRAQPLPLTISNPTFAPRPFAPLICLALLAGLAASSGLRGSWQESAPVQASRIAGIQGAGASTISLQNIDPSQSAVHVIDYYNQRGGAPVTVTRSGVAPYAASSSELGLEAVLSNGAYAVIASSDRPSAMLAQHYWATSGAATIIEAARPGTDLRIPALFKNHEGQASLISIQNTDTSAMARATVGLHNLDGSLATSIDLAIGPGTSTTLDMTRSSQTAGLPAGWQGWLSIQSSTLLAAQSLVDLGNSDKGVYDFTAQPAVEASEKRYAPLVYAQAQVDPDKPSAGQISSQIHVLNAGSESAPLSVRYRGLAGDCAGKDFVTDPTTLTADHAVTLLAGDTLPAGCTAAATIEAAGGAILASVVALEDGGARAWAYNSLGQDEAALLVHLPRLHSHRWAFDISSHIQVQNVGSAAASVELELLDSGGRPVDGCGSGCNATIATGAGHSWDLSALEPGPGALYHSAVLRSDQPIAAVAFERSASGATDLAGYAGIAELESSSDPEGLNQKYMVLSFKGGAGLPDIPAPSPTPMLASPTPVSATATAEPPTAIPDTATPETARILLPYLGLRH